jgi:hypothetical protein
MKKYVEPTYSDLFVPYNIAFELKRLKFNESCLAFFDERKELKLIERPAAFWSRNDSVDWNHTIFRKGKVNLCTAPTWEQVIDWFEKNHGLYLYVGTHSYEWSAGVYDLRSGLEFHWTHLPSKSRKEGLIESILKGIKTIDK